MLLLVSMTTYAQKDYRAGYIITQDFDTLHGLIDYRGEIKNSKECWFKENGSSEEVAYNPGEIYSYRFVDGKYYISKKIIIDGQEVTGFVEYLVNAQANLYYYADYEKGSHYYIENESEGLVELKNEKKEYYEDNVRYVRETNEHIGALTIVFKDTPDLIPKINNVDLTHKSLIKITKDYHNIVCDSVACIIYDKPIPILSFKMGPSIGYEMIWHTFVEEWLNFFEYYLNTDFKVKTYPMAGMYIKAYVPRINEKITMDNSIMFAFRQYEGFTRYEDAPQQLRCSDVYVDQLLASTSISLVYNYPRGKYRPLFGFGVYGDFAIWNNQDLDFYRIVNSTDYYYYTLKVNNLVNYNLGFKVEAGISTEVENKEVFSNFSFRYGNGLHQRNYASTMSAVTLRVGYFF